MNILQSISYFYPAWSYGGPGKLVYELSKELSRRHNVTVYSTDAFNNERRRNNVEQQFVSEKFKTRFFTNISNTLAFDYKVFLPYNHIPTISREMRRFQVIHLHEFFTSLSATLPLFAVRQNIPYVLSAHGTLDHFHLSHRKGSKALFMKLFGNYILRHASMCIAATKEEIEEYVLLGIDKKIIAYVPNGISMETTAVKRGSFRKKNSIPMNKKMLVYLGRIHPLKGLDMLVKAFHTIHTQTNAVLVIAGSDDGYGSELRKLIDTYKLQDSIMMPGIMAGEDKKELYTDADVYVYPSPAEGFSLSILEAASYGLPLVLTTGCKFHEIVENNAGIEAEYDEEAFAKALMDMLKSEDRQKRSGENAKKLVMSKYTIPAMAKRLEKIYLEVHHD